MFLRPNQENLTRALGKFFALVIPQKSDANVCFCIFDAKVRIFPKLCKKNPKYFSYGAKIILISMKNRLSPYEESTYFVKKSITSGIVVNHLSRRGQPFPYGWGSFSLLTSVFWKTRSRASHTLRTGRLI